MICTKRLCQVGFEAGVLSENFSLGTDEAASVTESIRILRQSQNCTDN